jgi:hypothetical protein
MTMYGCLPFCEKHPPSDRQSTSHQMFSPIAQALVERSCSKCGAAKPSESSICSVCGYYNDSNDVDLNAVEMVAPHVEAFPKQIPGLDLLCPSISHIANVCALIETHSRTGYLPTKMPTRTGPKRRCSRSSGIVRTDVVMNSNCFHYY